MKATHCSSSSVLLDVIRSQSKQGCLPPSFLLPAFSHQRSSFSTTSSVAARTRRDRNTMRGMSALRKTGLGSGFRLSAKIEDLPRPILRGRSQVPTDENHGLWGFFNEKRQPIIEPQELANFGRAWTVRECRQKDFDDLWKLFWTCIKEINIINTADRERAHQKIGFGDYEAQLRRAEVRKTIRSIKQALTERWRQFENAREEAMLDPTINLSARLEAGQLAYVSIDGRTENKDLQLSPYTRVYKRDPVAVDARAAQTPRQIQAARRSLFSMSERYRKDQKAREDAVKAEYQSYKQVEEAEPAKTEASNEV